MINYSCLKINEIIVQHYSSFASSEKLVLIGRGQNGRKRIAEILNTDFTAFSC